MLPTKLNKTMNTPQEEADNLIELFSQTSEKISDYSRIEYPTAVLHAKLCVSKMLSNTGSDRAYLHYSEVQEILENI